MQPDKTVLPRWMIVGLILMLLILIVGGTWFYRFQKRAMRLEVEDNLSTIAQLKVAQITSWRGERLGDGAVLSNNQFFANGVARFIETPSDANAKPIVSYFRSLQMNYKYTDVFLVNSTGKLLLSLSGTIYPSSEFMPALASAFDKGSSVIIDLHAFAGEPRPHLSVLSPLFYGEKNDRSRLGAVILVSDAAEFLYPLIQSWPTFSKTAETLLVRRDGDNVLFLNNLRHQLDTALKLRIPIDRLDLPASMAILGHKGIVTGKDYRGVDVVAAILPVPGSPWFMVSKVDSSELFADWYWRSTLIITLLLGLMFLIGTVGMFLWQRERKRHYQAIYQSEVALRASAERHSVTLKSIGDAVIATDAQGLVELLNPIAEELTGWAEDEARGQPLKKIFHIVHEKTKVTVEDPVAKVLREGVVIGLANHTILIARDGAEHPIADSGAPIRDGAGNITGVVLVFRDQTEEREYQNGILESEEKYRLLSENTLDVIWTMNLDLEFTYVNQAISQLTGHSQEEWIGSRLSEHFDELNFAKMGKIIAEEIAKGPNSTGVIFEVMALDKKLNQIPVEIHGNVIFNIEGQPILLQGITRDISDRIRAQEALQASEKRFSTIFHTSPAPIAIAHASNNRLVDANKAWEKLTGYAQSEAIGHTALDLNIWVDPGQRVQISEDIKKQSAVRKEITIRRKSGEYRQVLMSADLVEIFGERYLLTMGQDITFLKENEERIQHLNNVLRAIRSINQLIVRERNQDNLIAAACQLLVNNRGYASALIVLADKEDRPISWATAGIAANSKTLIMTLENGELPPCCKQPTFVEKVFLIDSRGGICSDCAIGEKCVETQSLFVRISHGEMQFGYLVAALESSLGANDDERDLFSELSEDIGYALHGLEMNRAHRDSEQKRKELERQLVQAQKMESVGRLAGGVAHDYNNVLSVIVGYSELSLDLVNQDDPIFENLKEILKAAKKSADISRQLLAFARQQTINPKILDLNDVVESMLKMLRRLIGEDIELIWQPAPNLWPINMDPSQIDQILANLCINARDAISNIGEITIETETFSFDEAYCADHIGFVPGDFVMLAVSDNGHGMDKETQEKVFEPFFTTKGIGKGTGLGLATVYGIVKQNNGFINIYSEPGLGTTIKIYLSRHQGLIENKPTVNIEELPMGQGETVLVVEDDPSILGLIEKILVSLKYRVLSANSPGQALTLAKTHADEIALLITDVVMPEMNGREIFEKLNVHFPDVKCLFMSGYTANVIAHRGVLDHGVNFIHKPFSKSEFAKKIRTVLND